jgi:hypothetical protein
MLRMPTIEERTSEHDDHEELERKDREYKKKIDNLKRDIKS